MRSLADLIAVVLSALDPDFDLAAAQRHFGTITEWTGARGRVDAPPSDYRTVVIETSRGEFAGIQLRLARPLDVDWDELKRQLGAARDNGPDVDDWGGPSAFGFTLAGPRAAGDVLLYAHRHETRATVHRVMIRPHLR